MRADDLLDRVEGLAAKQAIALGLPAEVERQGISQSELAARSGKSIRARAAPRAARKRAS